LLSAAAIDTLIRSAGLDAALEACMSRIERATDEDTKRAVYRLRHAIYVEEQGKAYVAQDELLFDEADQSSEILVMRDDDGCVVGTVRITFADDPHAEIIAAPLRLDLFRGIRLRNIAILSRLVLDRAYRNGPAFSAFLISAYISSRAMGAHIGLCHCRVRLAPLFERFGFRAYAPTFDDGRAGLQVPLVIIGSDREYFESVQSPIASVSDWFVRDEASLLWFSRELPGVHNVA
jgi:predicted GNAT family N-acyltransferase